MGTAKRTWIEDQLAEAYGMLDEGRKELTALRAEFAAAKEENERLRSGWQATCEAHDVACAENAKLRGEVAELLAAADGTQSMLTQAQRENERLKAALSDMSGQFLAERKECEREKHRADGNHKALVDYIDKHIEENRELRHEIDRMVLALYDPGETLRAVRSCIPCESGGTGTVYGRPLDDIAKLIMETIRRRAGLGVGG